MSDRTEFARLRPGPGIPALMTPAMPRLLVVLFCLLAAAGPLVSQSLEPRAPTPRSTSVAFDINRGIAVLFGGAQSWPPSAVLDDTWTFDGSLWHRVAGGPAPTPRVEHSMTFDSFRNRTVLFGGRGATGLVGDTWLFDGAAWSPVAVGSAPTPRRGTRMVFDAVRGRTMLFGGLDAFGEVGDTWEFDGSTWTMGANGPAARFGHLMAFDPARSRTVLYGGFGYTTFQDTWEYDGQQWVLRFPTTSPATAIGGWSATTHPSGAGILLAGTGNGGGTETWTYDGSNWSLVGSVPVVVSGQLVDDPAHGRVLAIATSPVDVHEYSGAQWVPVGLTVRTNHAIAFDQTRNCTVLYGGSDPNGPGQDTWELRGNGWTRVATPAQPGARSLHAMVYETHRGRTILFGGDANGWKNDTWAFDGTNWSLVATSGPSPRSGHAMIYDSGRARTVLFGGYDPRAAGQLADTWEFDGTTWKQRATAHTPPSAYPRPGLAYDSGRAVTVLCGAGPGVWEYDGNDWSLVNTQNQPLWSGNGLGYDATRGRIVLQGGTWFVGGCCGSFGCSSCYAVEDTWEYDGIDWTRIAPHHEPSMPLIYDSVRQRLIGTAGTGMMIEYVPPTTPTFTQYGTGCPGSAGVPRLDTIGNATPALGSTFPLRVTALPSQSTVAYLAFGFDIAQWSGTPLPIELGALGLPGCRLWIAPADGIALPAVNGIANFGLAIPNLPSLAGLTLGTQALAFDPLSPTGLGGLSNAAMLRLF